ncbi:hypothetical protein [Streptantibioticus ferralitis]|uniref:Uncharacterized protein n=1 Tax=Streptantibioticus ferralitis TaxID=236510 RepID=A0ABT5Z551_9ACTN|nr:hypothetical protein [Streptantibioticus ferralitis]MDF2258950.1 hypothetical protein [Streptantibioticus ferralitis]
MPRRGDQRTGSGSPAAYAVSTDTTPHGRILRAVGGGHQSGLPHPERGRQRLRHLGTVADPGKADEARLARVPSGRLHRQPGLARSAGPDQRDQARGGQPLLDGTEFVNAADEAAQLGRE